MHSNAASWSACVRATCTLITHPPRPPQAASLLRDGWRQLLYLSVAVTATANLLQAFGQQRVGAAELLSHAWVKQTEWHNSGYY